MHIPALGRLVSLLCGHALRSLDRQSQRRRRSVGCQPGETVVSQRAPLERMTSEGQCDIFTDKSASHRDEQSCLGLQAGVHCCTGKKYWTMAFN